MKIEANVTNINVKSQAQNNINNESMHTAANNGSSKNGNIPLDQKKEFEMSISEKTIIDAIEKANKKLIGVKKELHFSVHKATKAIMVKIIDSETEEVVREIPPEKTLDLVAKMIELAGIFVDEKR